MAYRDSIGGAGDDAGGADTWREVKKGIDSILSSEREGAVQYAFEFDEEKSCGNRVKHGIDFVEAQELWLDDNLLRAASRCETEPRFLFVGMVGDKLWSAIVTYRGETIRIISVRRSRVREVEAYESQ